MKYKLRVSITCILLVTLVLIVYSGYEDTEYIDSCVVTGVTDSYINMRGIHVPSCVSFVYNGITFTTPDKSLISAYSGMVGQSVPCIVTERIFLGKYSRLQSVRLKEV